jgi:hypothetical protein
MRHRHLSRLDTLRQPHWAQWIADTLKLTDYSDQLTRTALAKCLLVAAALRLAVSAVARTVTGAGREQVRRGIAASQPRQLRQLEACLAAGFRHVLPRSLRGVPLPIAIDIHRRPYYGDRRNTPGITGGRSEAGSGWFWSYATVVSLLPGHRHTLALTTIEPSDKLADVVERLLVQVAYSGVAIRYVLLDRTFYTAGVVNTLSRRFLRFIIPMVRRGRAVEKFFRRGCRGWFDHTFESRRREEQASVRVAVVAGPDGNRPLVFACSSGFTRLPSVALTYRDRFGIESSYRQLGECLAQTSSRDGVYRLLLVGLSLLIRAWWVVSDKPLGIIRWQLIVQLTHPTTTPAPATQNPITPALTATQASW